MKKYFISIIICFVLFVLLIPNGHTQHKPIKNKQLEIIPNEKEISKTYRNMRISQETNIPLVLYTPNYKVIPDTPENMARQYLIENANKLHLKADITDLIYKSTKETPSGYRVRFIQYFDKYPLYNSTITISINRKNEIVFVINDYKIDQSFLML